MDLLSIAPPPSASSLKPPGSRRNRSDRTVARGPFATVRMRIPKDDSRHPLAERLKAFIRNPPFPCVGAKSALTRGRMRVVVARDIGLAHDDARVHAALMAFVTRYKRKPDLFQSFAVIFEGPGSLSEERFEARLWERIQSLTDHDSRLGHPPDPRVASDPNDPHFSLSLAGEAFFVVGLHPRASRRARRFEAPTLVFNLHDQFERLRAEGRYEKLRETITARDISWTGSANPMLAMHGKRSEAEQYSGRAVNADWNCPFRRSALALPRSEAEIAADLRQGAFLAPSPTASESAP